MERAKLYRANSEGEWNEILRFLRGEGCEWRCEPGPTYEEAESEEDGGTRLLYAYDGTITYCSGTVESSSHQDALPGVLFNVFDNVLKL